MKEHALEDIKKILQPLAEEMAKFGFEMHLVMKDNPIPGVKFKPEKKQKKTDEKR